MPPWIDRAEQDVVAAAPPRIVSAPEHGQQRCRRRPAASRSAPAPRSYEALGAALDHDGVVAAAGEQRLDAAQDDAVGGIGQGDAVRAGAAGSSAGAGGRAGEGDDVDAGAAGDGLDVGREGHGVAAAEP